ncbi:MAG: flavin prenyltransferase UbiX [Planctomycetota bacterium]
MNRPVVVAVTGASGAGYAVRLLDVLVRAGRTVDLITSTAAVQVRREELGLEPGADPADLPTLRESLKKYGYTDDAFAGGDAGEVRVHDLRNVGASIASGSYRTAGMAVCPCSTGTLAAVATGLTTNLVHRAAAVHLKERRKLIVVPRETPLGTIQLANMKTIADAGGVVLPAMPGFYHEPRSMADLIDFVVGRVCDQLEVDVELITRWGEAGSA